MKVLTRTRSEMIRRVTPAIVMMAILLVPAPAMAQQSCHSICAPTLLFHPGVITTNPFIAYTSSDESSSIHADTESLSLNASVDAVTPKETGG